MCVHSIVRHGGGGYTFNDVYAMPIHIRDFIIKTINDELKKSKKEDGVMSAEDVESGQMFKKPKDLPSGTYKSKTKKAP